MSQLSRWLVWAGVWCAALSLAESGPQSLRCTRRYFRHKAVQTDMNGLRCWGDVKIMSCWGRCLSSETPDWQFPYKQPKHPVCVHGERRHASARLPHCEPGVAPGTDIYHYVEARNCRCQICSSETTSCEWLPPNTEALSLLLSKQQTTSKQEVDYDLE